MSIEVRRLPRGNLINDGFEHVADIIRKVQCAWDAMA
jgi:hypothetical protein